MSVPALRFKYFDGREFPEWKSDLLGNYAETISSGKSNARNANGGYTLYGSTGAIGYADKYDYQGEKLLIARVGANAGYLYLVNGDYCVSDNTLMLSLKASNNYSFFFNLLTNTNLNKLVFGSGQPLITGGQLKTLDVAIPSLPEQTKIANFLTAVDEKIQHLTQKADLLAQYKKGVMQQIFSQDLRFKDDDGGEFPEWEEFSFDDLFFIANNKKTQIKSSDYLEFGETPVVDQGKKSIVGFTNNKEIYKDVPVVIFGDHTKILKWVDFKFASGADGTQVLKSYAKVFLKFGYYALCHIELPNLGYSRHMKELKAQFIFIPQAIEEQTKIANFLTAIDDKITQTQTQLAAVKQYKQGLLQQKHLCKFLYYL